MKKSPLQAATGIPYSISKAMTPVISNHYSVCCSVPSGDESSD